VSDALDLDAYLARIAHSGSVGPSLETLRALHLEHPLAIPFENLSTLVRDPVPLDIGALQEKLVERQRGGYCFEHNRLFADALKSIGFAVTELAARVVWGRMDASLGPRTHMVLLVELDGGRYLCDVGFGAVTLTAPLVLTTGMEQTTPHETFRLLERDGEFELEVELAGAWKSMYRFDLQAQRPIDYEVLNHFVATHPDSHFRTRLMAGLATPGGRHTLSDNRLSIHRTGRSSEVHVLASASEIERALRERFGIDPPAGPALAEALERLAALPLDG
jgi:N-hydroxyarylamine O-acetyltransferase